MWRKHSTASNGKDKDKDKDDKQRTGSGASAGASTPSNGSDNLPPGWTKKESHSQKGRFYYMSPEGKTQWTPPIVVPPAPGSTFTSTSTPASTSASTPASSRTSAASSSASTASSTESTSSSTPISASASSSSSAPAAAAASTVITGAMSAKERIAALNAKLQGNQTGNNTSFIKVSRTNSRQEENTSAEPAPAAASTIETTPKAVKTTPKPVKTTPKPVKTTPKAVKETPKPAKESPKPVKTTPKHAHAKEDVAAAAAVPEVETKATAKSPTKTKAKETTKSKAKAAKAKEKEKPKDKEKTKAKKGKKGKGDDDVPATRERRSSSSHVPMQWANEVEIEFTEPRLGVTLREVKQTASIPYPQFQAEVDDLPRINNRAGAAEIYNWSVRPHLRLTLRMRVVAIDDISVAGFTHREVVDRLRKSARPLRIRFANVEKGTLEDGQVPNDPSMLDEDGSAASASAYREQQQAFTRVLATGELHTEMWSIENAKLLRQLLVRKKKWDVLSGEYDRLNAERVAFKTEDEALRQDKRKYRHMIDQLRLQETQSVANPEFVIANDLAKKHAEMEEDIAKMTSGNKRLKKERLRLQAALDELEKELEELEDKKTDDDDGNAAAALDDDVMVGIDPNALPAEQLQALAKSKRFMEDEVAKEERKTAKVLREMDSLNRHLAKLTRHGSRSMTRTTSSSVASSATASSSSSSRRDHHFSRQHSHSSADPNINGTADGDLMDGSMDDSSADANEAPTTEAGKLEARVAELRKKQRSVVETLARAARTGDQDLARTCQKQRKAIRDELRKAQDALMAHNASERETEGSGKPTESNENETRDSRASKESNSSTATSSTRQRLEGKSTPVPSASSSTKLAAAHTDEIPTVTGFLKKGPTEWSERNLMRRIKTKRGARERWCEVTFDGFLRYYKRRGDPNVRGEIDLSDPSCEVICSNLHNGDEFVLCTSAQQSHFFTKSSEELRSWVNTLRAAHDQLIAKKQAEVMAKKVAAMEQQSQSQSPSHDDPVGDDEMLGRATLGF